MRGFTHIILIGGFCFNTAAVDIQPVAKILDSRCLDCHDSEARKGGINPVSYTHLTLPTICSV